MTNNQRRLFFRYVSVVGREPVYRLIEKMTSKRSSKDLSPTQASLVLSELEKLHTIAPTVPPKVNEEPPELPEIETLITQDQRAAIRNLAENLNFSAAAFAVFCKKNIGETFPSTEKSFLLIASAMNREISIRRRV